MSPGRSSGNLHEHEGLVLFKLPAAQSLDILGQLDFSLWAQETASLLSSCCQKGRPQIKCFISKTIIFVSVPQLLMPDYPTQVSSKLPWTEHQNDILIFSLKATKHTQSG